MSESNYSVYVHTSPCGKKYVGITKQNPIDRWKKGKAYPSNKYFTEEIEKYGWDNFQHEIVAEKLSKADAEAMEIKLIKEFKSDNKEFGYNITKAVRLAIEDILTKIDGKQGVKVKGSGKRITERNILRIGENMTVLKREKSM